MSLVEQKKLQWAKEKGKTKERKISDETTFALRAKCVLNLFDTISILEELAKLNEIFSTTIPSRQCERTSIR